MDFLGYVLGKTVWKAFWWKMIFHSMQTDHFKKLMSMAEGNRIEGESMDCSTYCVPDNSLGVSFV